MNRKYFTFTTPNPKAVSDVYAACRWMCGGADLYGEEAPFGQLLQSIRFNHDLAPQHAQDFVARCGDNVRLHLRGTGHFVFTTPDITLAMIDSGERGWLVIATQWESRDQLRTFLEPLQKQCGDAFELHFPIADGQTLQKVTIRQAIASL